MLYVCKLVLTKNKMTTCPIVKAINNIYAGGFEQDAEGVYVGGVERVLDNVIYWITKRSMEVARFELGNPTPADIKAKFDELYPVEYTRLDLYNRIYKCIDAVTVQTQFYNVYDTVGELESLLVYYTEIMVQRGVAPNISIGSVELPPWVGEIIAHQHDALTKCANKLISYVNAIHIDGLPRVNIPLVAPFDMTIDLALPIGDLPEDPMLRLRMMMNIELDIARHIQAIEAYQCDVLRAMGKVEEACLELTKMVM